MSKYHFGQFTPEHLELLKEGIQLYNDGHYWMCHEVVEDLWMDHIGDNARYVFWVVIQLATALYHWEDSNLNGASGMVKKAKRKIEFVENNHVESDILEKYLDWSKIKDIVKSIPEKPVLEDFQKLAKFKFQDPTSWKV
jgi:predicted metal-dependent hydrolase